VVTTTPPVPRPDPTAEARQKLRDFALFLDQIDPMFLAQCATDIDKTLAVCDRLQRWFHEYETALQRRTR
jgi:hypothetical protein